VWTAVELFCATSKFASDFAGASRPVYTVKLNAELQLTAGAAIEEKSGELRSQMHEVSTWSLPPRANLVSQDDLLVLEPLAVIMRAQAMPRIVAAAMGSLKVALQQYIEADLPTFAINAAAPGTGVTALHCAARRADEEMIRMLLAVPKVDANVRDKHGDTPLHDIATARRATVTIVMHQLSCHNALYCGGALVLGKCILRSAQ
jgi:hypothetical protein